MESILVFLPINIKELNDQDLISSSFLKDVINYKSYISEIKPFQDEKTEEELCAFNVLHHTPEVPSNDDKKFNIVLNNKNVYIQKIDCNTTNTADNENIFKSYNCWWCCHKFNTEVIYIPEYVRDDVFYVRGNFCSFNCALSYNYNDNSQNNFCEKESLIYLFYKKINNVLLHDNLKINYAPNKEILEKFGGPVNIEDYRKSFNFKNYNCFYPPFSLIIPEFEEINLNKVISDVKNDDKLVLKRKRKKNISMLDLFK